MSCAQAICVNVNVGDRQSIGVRLSLRPVGELASILVVIIEGSHVVFERLI